MNKKELSEIKKILSRKPKTVILTHFNPDGDAIGSALGVYHCLKNQGIRARVLVPDSFPAYLAWMPASGKIIIARHHEGAALKTIASAELIFCVDFNSLNRLMGMAEALNKSRAVKILIDHHRHPENFPDYLWSEPDACSASELVYKFFIALDGGRNFNLNVLECLYTGILTDSMGFRIGNATAQTHRIVAELIDRGVQSQTVHNRVYDTNTLDRLRLIGYCLTEKLKVFPEYSTALIALSKKELKKFNYKVGDTEGVVNYALSIEGIRLAAFVVERNIHVKISLRSKGNVPVHLIAKKYFNGGGHFHAAGGEVNLSLKDTVKKIISVLPQYKKYLMCKT